MWVYLGLEIQLLLFPFKTFTNNPHYLTVFDCLFVCLFVLNISNIVLLKILQMLPLFQILQKLQIPTILYI